MDIKMKFDQFLVKYPVQEKDSIWDEHSSKFRGFWNNRIMASDGIELTTDEMDQILLILDKSAKGSTPEQESVARVMIPQGAWYRMLKGLKDTHDIRDVMDDILNAENDDDRAEMIDTLYRVNNGRIKYLTGQSGNAVGAMLFAYHPRTFLSMLSLNDRIKLIGYLGIDYTDVGDSVGRRIMYTNRILLTHLRATLGSFSPRTFCSFFYMQDIKSQWKDEQIISTTQGGEVGITIPGKEDDSNNIPEDTLRSSMRIQAAIARIGEAMGYSIWLPKSDRSRVLTAWTPGEGKLLDHLPLNYDNSTNKTIEQIDVIWLSRNMIVRLFEVEHTTSIYSGILRMADLLSLQPNLDIRMHIVAPSEKQDKVLEEIRRPVFANLQSGPLMKRCTYIPYENIEYLDALENLKYLKIDVMKEYEIFANEEP